MKLVSVARYLSCRATDLRWLSVLVLGLLGAGLLLTAAISAQPDPAIDTEALIEQFVSVDMRQREQIHTLEFDAEYLEGKRENNDEFKQEARYIKKVFIKFVDDTALYREKYLEYYKDGKLQSPEDTRKKGEEKIEKARKRNSRNVAYPMLRPFYPEFRADYEISYDGISDDIENRTCYHFRVKSKVEDDQHVDGDYYFDTDSFHLVRVDFSPAKLVKKAMFKLSKLDMSIIYGPADDGFWLPREFDIDGKGRAAFLFGVNFAGIEYYRNPQVNVELPDSLFEDNDDK